MNLLLFRRLAKAAGIGFRCHPGKGFEYLEEEGSGLVAYGVGCFLNRELGIHQKMFRRCNTMLVEDQSEIFPGFPP